MPFLYDIQQPWRGLLGLIITAFIGIGLYFIFVHWWRPWGEQSWLVAAQYFFWVFNWIFWLLFHFNNWPFQKMSQPWQGVSGMLLALLLAWPTRQLMHAVAWDRQQFNLGVAIMFWIFLLSVWSGMPLFAAHQGKQPLTGINGFVTSTGLGLLTFFFLPERQILGMELGFPFVWFVVAVVFGVILEDWPFHTCNQPMKALVLVGYLSLFSFACYGVLYYFGLDLYALDAKAGAFLLIYLLVLLVPPGLFNNWPLHRLHTIPRGIITIVLATAVAILLFRYLVALSPSPGPSLYPGTEFAFITAQFVFLFKVLVMGQCLFIGWWAYFGLMGMAKAPRPEGSFTLSPHTEH